MCESLNKDEEAKVSKLSRETHDWFENMKENDSSNISGRMNDRMKNFFSEAQQRFSYGNSELFDDFVRDNETRFAELLDSRRKKSIFGAESVDIFSSGDNLNQVMKTNSENIHNSKFNSDQQSFIRKSEFSHSSQDQVMFPRYSSQLFGTSRMFGINMNGFGDFSDFMKSPIRESGNLSLDLSPVNSRNESCKESYEMSSSKSMFEYCSDTSSYRFSSELISQRYDYTSESEEDEDDEFLEKESLDQLYDTRSECSDLSSVRELNNATIPAIQYPDPAARLEKVYKIANELLTTERTYVAALHLVDQIFHFKVDNENRAHKMFPQEVVTQMFSNIKSIYKLHSEHLLPQLETRIKNWSDDPRIGDVMRNFAPFLKMYTEYVKNFDDAMNLINCWYAKLPRFAGIMDEIHKMSECGNLTLQHHMLNPIQRVPRYKLLLSDYLKKLSEDSKDREDTEKALELVSTAANHANDAMKRIDKFKKLLEIQEMIGGGVDLVSPTRELIKEGKIVKISARSGDHQERYLFLFSDMVLLCSQRLMSGRVVSGPCYRVRAKLAIEGLVVADGDNIETANSFYIRNSHKSIELYTQTPEEKVGWIEALCKVMCEFVKRKSSLQITDQALLEMGLGKKPPMLLKQDSISHCMACHTHLSAFAFKKKKHCKACGIVVCSKCSGQKVLLGYDQTKPNRVCDQCYAIVTKQKNLVETLDNSSSPSMSPQSPIESISPTLSPSLSRGVLEVKSNDPCVISGYLHLKTRGKTWAKRWFSLHSDFVLYSFKTHEDDHAVTSTPIPGYIVTVAEKSDSIDSKQFVFKIYHSKNRVYFFQASNQQEMQNWVHTLNKASKAECLTPDT